VSIRQIIQWASGRGLKPKPTYEPPHPVKTVGFTNQPWTPEMRLIMPGQVGPNMPKYQPCAACTRGSKRVSKTIGGANYRCRYHGEFFVRKA